MRCVTVEVRLNFEADIAFQTPDEAVRSAFARAGGEVSGPPRAGTLSGPIQVNVRAKRLGALVNGRSWSIRSERPVAAGTMLADVLEHFEMARSLFRGAPVGTVVVATHWIEPLDTGWDELLQTYIRAFYRPATLPPGTSDTAVVFDVDRDDGHDTYRSGPMEKRQLLSSFLRFWSADEPQVPDMLFFLRHFASTRVGGPVDAAGLEETAHGALGRAASFAEDHYAQFSRCIGAP